MSIELQIVKPEDLIRQSTDIAGICKGIVTKSAVDIQGRKYVRCEGWMAIATAHGCVASCRDVTRIDGGFRAIGEIRRMSDGAVLCTAEGFVGEDEPTWFGGERGDKMFPKRPDYAIRAMAQTRAISRACRSAFAHVVVLMDAGLSTTPAEEVPDGGFSDHADDGKLTDEPVPGQYWEIRKKQGNDAANEWLAKAFDGAKVGTRKTDDGWRVVVYSGGKTANATVVHTGDQGGGSVKGAGSTTGATSGNVAAGNGENTALIKTAFDTVVHWGKAKGPIKGKALSELPDDTVEWLGKYYAEKETEDPDGKKLSKQDRQLKAAIAVVILSRRTKGKPAVENVSPGARKTGDGFNGRDHETLFKNLEWASISPETFMSVAREKKWVPASAASFMSMSNETAKKFIDDWQTISAAIDEWIEAQNGADGTPTSDDDEIPGLEESKGAK